MRKVHEAHGRPTIPRKRIRAAVRKVNSTGSKKSVAGNNGWQPIETAPMDGAILLWVPENKCTFAAIWDKWLEGWSIFGGSAYTTLGSATHWQPLPPPPETKT